MNVKAAWLGGPLGEWTLGGVTFRNRLTNTLGKNKVHGALPSQ